MSAIKLNFGFKCILCESTTNLVSHHLNSYASFPSQKTDIANGVCLCKKCHVSFHKQHGFKNNTKEQFLEYKKTCQNFMYK